MPLTVSHAFRFIALLGLLYLIWEAAQIPFYTIWRDGTWGEIVFAVAHCTVGDVIIGVFSATGAILLTGMQWPRNTRSRLIFMGYFIGISLSYTIFSEWLNVMVRKNWAYSAIMPVIPPLGTGLFPVLQWIMMPLMASWLTLRK
ncbi:MAG: hypothetical protein ABI705_12370 [Aestuariivirga sp.]